MDAEPELLPFLPRLFADLEELGARTSEVLQVLAAAGVNLGPGSRVLDLGCGKGAVGLALAAKFGCTVHGVDGMAAFVEHAERRASSQGLAESCIFAEADIRDAVVQSRDYDLVCLLALGDLLGRADETIAALRQCVVPGGFMLIDDAYLREGAAPHPDLVDCYDHADTLALLQAHGDQVVAELVVDDQDSAANYQAMTTAIVARADELARTHPDHAELLAAFAKRQREEEELLTGPVVGAVWVLQRGVEPTS